MYKLFFILRYLRKRRIAMFAVLSVWLCVGMVLVVISVMGGFLDMVKERSRGLLSDIVVDNATLQGFPYYQEFIGTLLRELPDKVVAATPVIYNYGIMRIETSDYTKPVRVVGVRLDEYEGVNDFENSLFYDKYYPGTTSLAAQGVPVVGFDDDGRLELPADHQAAFQKWRESETDRDELAKYAERRPGEFAGNLGPPGYAEVDEGERRPGIIVGCDLINDSAPDGNYQRYYHRGTDILLTLLPLTAGGRLGGEGAVVVPTRLADDSHTRVFEIDNICVYVDFDLLQRRLAMEPQQLVDGGTTPARASQVLVKLVDGVDAQTMRAEIQEVWKRFRASLADVHERDATLLDFVKVETWQERQVKFIAAVEKEKVLVTILFGVISLVAVVLIGCIFYMVVAQKIRDIGIIKSVGASSSGVAAIFIGFGAAVGVVGTTLGTISGVAFVHYINDIQDRLARFNPNLKVWSPEVYTFDRIPNVVKADEAVVIAVVAVLASMVGALIPALLAARVWPVRALRYE